MSDQTEVQWGLMTTRAVNHGNTLPKNRKGVGDITPVSSIEEAKDVLETRERWVAGSWVIVSRTITTTISEWERV